MKKFKTKFLSLILCIAMCLSVLTGCSLITRRSNADNSAIALKVGDREITREELINSYYSFYQQNYYYYMYYDEDYIMDVFYQSVVAREVVLAETDRLIETGDIVISQKDIDKVWTNIFDYIRGQVDAKEKALLLQKEEVAGDEEKLPERLQTKEEENSEDKAYKYEPYNFAEDVEIKPYEKGEKGVEKDLLEQIELFKSEELYKYKADGQDDLDEDEEVKYETIPEEQRAMRYEAFKAYLADLIFSAKANQKNSKADAVFKAEFERLYKSYNENMLYNEYQEYINATVIGTADGAYENKLSNLEIYKKYQDLLNISREGNTIEDNYVSVITSTSTSSLVLYHYNGKYVYFTVQHLLVSFDEETVNTLKEIWGYETSKDYYFREAYEKIRATFVDENKLTTTERDDKGYIITETTTAEDGTETTKNKEVSITAIKEKYFEERDQLIQELEAKGASDADKAHAKAVLFQKYVWKYSSDTGSLNTGLQGLGFNISSEPDKHGSLVKDFTNGARELFKGYQKFSQVDGYESIVVDEQDVGDIADVVKSVVSDYGVHLMILTGVYEPGAIVDLDSLSGTTDAEKADELVEILKTIYVSNTTDQTVYDYIYEQLKTDLVGSNGKYFSDERTKLVDSYEDEDKVVYYDKMSYKELNDAIN